MNHPYTITFHLTDDQEARLLTLTQRFNSCMGANITMIRLLESLLVTGSAMLIDERMTGISAALDLEQQRREAEVK